MTPEVWFKSLPPITKAVFVLSVLLTGMVSFGIIDVQKVLESWPHIVYGLQLWRPVTSVIYCGTLSFNFLFELYMLVTYLRGIEIHLSGPKDYTDLFGLFLFFKIHCFIIGYFIPLYFQTPVFISMLVYLWSRKDPSAIVILYGFTFKAWHLPFVFTLLALLINTSIIYNIIGIFIGHTYYFIKYIIPRKYSIDI